MQSLWSDADADRMAGAYVAQGIHPDLAIRTYTARLLGAVPSLVMHGGGNTSVKLRLPDLFGEPVDVLCVKGSGRDLASIEPDGHPAVRLAPLRRLRTLDALSDEDMVNVQRQNLLDTSSPNPSVETLLHAWLPHRFVDHTHAVTATAIAALPDVETTARAIYGERLACVPYVMPGFQLAKLALEVYERNPRVEGLLLAKHGLFTFAETARESYALMIDMVTLAEQHIAANARPNRLLRPSPLPSRLLAAESALPLLRGVLAQAAGDRAPPHWLLCLRSSARIRRFAEAEGVADLAMRGVATPEQVIRMKARPCLLPPANAADPQAWRERVMQRVHDFMREYDAYFARNDAGFGRRRLDPLPRVCLVPGLGLIGVGASAGSAATAADIAEAWIDAVLDAEAIGRFVSISEAEHFEMEYWSLEQAKLGRTTEPALARQVVVVTGGGGAIGSATARAFAAEGAQIAILDCNEAAANAAQQRLPGAIAQTCDVTDPNAVRHALDAVARHFGGVDIVVSNAGAAHGGMIAELDEAMLRRGFEINFFAHQNVAREAVRLLRLQGFGGALLFNVSKQAVNPGPGFGAYGTPKAALLALMRQYALEHGVDGIRVNAVNADRIRSGLLTETMITERAHARGVDTDAYLAGNLLGQEVRAEDVGRAFVALALQARTTGHVMTVDGGNVAAMVR
ncbi:bifunctional aldolase/short-chain dehydrogenase [Lichenicoccus sp.]|uniref:bifunctional aldolase/short-chain dehydrogenase n=1 Tax=Lichenicoccus sp. TaxID=2781899 RepID=UPI003D0A10C2